MGWVGADVAALRQAAAKFRTAAGEIDAAVGDLSPAVRDVWWKGEDADKFRDQWGQNVTDLRTVTDSLRATADRLDQQANQQEETSRQLEAAAAAAAAPAPSPGTTTTTTTTPALAIPGFP